MKRWKVSAELNSRKDDYEVAIIKAEDEDKAKKAAKKYFVKKMKATDVKILDVKELGG